MEAVKGPVEVLVKRFAHDSIAEPVMDPVEALVKKFTRVAVPPSPDAAGADGGEDDATGANDKPREDGATDGGGSS